MYQKRTDAAPLRKLKKDHRGLRSPESCRFEEAKSPVCGIKEQWERTVQALIWRRHIKFFKTDNEMCAVDLSEKYEVEIEKVLLFLSLTILERDRN